MWRIIYSILSGLFATVVVSVVLTFFVQPVPEDGWIHKALGLAAVTGGVAIGLLTFRQMNPASPS